MKPEHKRMSRMLGYCLTLDSTQAWMEFSLVAEIRLSVAERTALAFAALCSLDHDLRVSTSAAAIRPAGVPLPPFLGGMDDARRWASAASRDELKAHALAIYERMNPRDQAAFFQHICEVEIAA